MKYYIGIEVGVKQISVGIVDRNGKLVRKDVKQSYTGLHYSEILNNAADMAKALIEYEGIDIKDVKSIGVGCPGIPNDKEGIIVRNYTLNFQNTPVRAQMQKHFKMPIYVENDGNCAALAESVTGAAEDINSSVTIRIGNGIGGGIIINNEIYTGFNYAAAELGHMVIAFKGQRCTCGRKGCWEAYASLPALIKQTKEAAIQNPESKIHEIVSGNLDKINELTAFEAAKLGDVTAKKVYETYLEYLAEGITNIINLLMPEVIIIGGPISKLGDSLIKPLKVLVDDRVYAKNVPLPEFKIAEVSGAAVMIGAAMLGLFKDR